MPFSLLWTVLLFPSVTSTQIIVPDPVSFDLVDVVLAIWARKAKVATGAIFCYFAFLGEFATHHFFCYIKLVVIVLFLKLPYFYLFLL
jgi:hypothetical protein